MKTEPIDIRKKLREYRLDNDLVQEIQLPERAVEKAKQALSEHGTLPNNVLSDENNPDVFYTVYTPSLTQEEIDEYLTYRQLNLLRSIRNCQLDLIKNNKRDSQIELLKSIRNCLYFFVALTVIGLIILWLFLVR